MSNIRKTYTKENIEAALFSLLKKKKFNDITILEITTKAGVNRVSFYRNYNSKEDIIINYLDKKTNEWWDKQIQDKSGDVILGLFNHYYNEKEILLLLYQSNLSHLLYQNILDCSGPKENLSNNVAYTNGWISGGIFGFLDEWIKRGCIETPQELAKIFKNRKSYYENIDLINESYTK
jgi:AcrR family transcriptional regulator